MGKWCLHASSFIFDRIIIKVAGNQDRHKSSVEFDFGPNQTTHFGVTCVTKLPVYIYIYIYIYIFFLLSSLFLSSHSNSVVGGQMYIIFTQENVNTEENVLFMSHS